ncbi:hypothetical protein SNEBB_003010 [Seison nebaliae]|nr:hypothetical protein SNEBB_003010 [Seison nebaliae]
MRKRTKTPNGERKEKSSDERTDQPAKNWLNYSGWFFSVFLIVFFLTYTLVDNDRLGFMLGLNDIFFTSPNDVDSLPTVTETIPLKRPENGKSSNLETHINFSSASNNYNYSVIIPTAGKDGSPFLISLADLSDLQKRQYDEGWKLHNFNNFVSSIIPLNRTIRDVRMESCKRELYDKMKLPEVSIIICFRDESFTVLLRSIYSIIAQTPPHLLREIILVDDFSSLAELKEPLANYLTDHMEDFGGDPAIGLSSIKVKILRGEERLGLMRARIVGARYATAEVIIYLDSHIECTPGWIEPLIHTIQTHPNSIAAPIIDAIDDMTFEYIRSEILVGGMDWKLTFRWHSVNSIHPQYEMDSGKPIKNPFMAGGLFAVRRDYFAYIGLYDSEMSIWGIENVELSLRVWCCSGVIYKVPCSHVGHIFRKERSSNLVQLSPQLNNLEKNLLRTITVWMDKEFQDYFLYRSQMKRSLIKEIGNIDSQLQLKNRLKCSDFSWFINEVYPFLPLPASTIYSGHIYSVKMKNYCLFSPIELDKEHSAIMHVCETADIDPLHFVYLGTKEIRRDHNCLKHNDPPNNGIELSFPSCAGHPAQKWEITEFQQIKNLGTNKCVMIQPNFLITMTNCELANEMQIFQWEDWRKILERKTSTTIEL